MATESGLWACGTLGRAHGLKGELYLNLAPRGLEYLSQGVRFYLSREGAARPPPVEVHGVGGDDRRPLVLLEPAHTRDEALLLQGATVLAAGGELDELPFYPVGQLIGLRVTSGGKDLGTVVDVLANVANEILEIRAGDGKSVLVPFVGELVDVDLDGGVVVVREGLL
jgi:16S rRNA processing protein RimM